MKKFIVGVIAVMSLAGCQKDEVPMINTTYVENFVINEHSVPIFQKKAALTTDTAKNFSIDLPKRCTVDWNNQQIVSVVPEQPIAMHRVDKGDELPKFQVNDYEFVSMNLKTAIERLLEGTKIKVIADDPVSENISGAVSSGTLADAVDLMTRLGKMYYSYDAESKEIHLFSHTKWLMKMPKDQYIVMALLDAMHGENMRNLIVNWEDMTVLFEGNYRTERDMSRMIADVGSKKYLIAWDVDVYRLYPRAENPINWMNIIPAFGDKNIKMSVPGVVGRLLVVSPEINTKTLSEFMSQQANVVLISQGTFVIPNSWQSRFDIGQCSREERLETDLTIGATGKYGPYADGSMKKIDAKIVLRTGKGELSSFNVPTTLGDNYVVIGIPTHAFVADATTTISPYAELVAFISPRLISIQSAGEAAARPGLSGNDLRAFLADDMDDSEF